MTKPYPTDAAPTPGDFEHSAIECERHGVGPGCRAFGSSTPFQCVACLLEVGKPAPPIEAVAAPTPVPPSNGHAPPSTASYDASTKRLVRDYEAATAAKAREQARNLRAIGLIAAGDVEQAIEVLKGGG